MAAATTIEEPKVSKEKAEANPEAPETPEAAPAKKSGLLPVLISSAVMAVVMGAFGFAMAYFVLPSRMQAATKSAAPASPAVATASATTAAPASTPTPAPATDEKTQRSAADLAASGGKAATKFTIEEITVNIADTRGNRFVRAGVDFEAAPAVLEELEANRPRMVDTLGQVLSTKTLDELTAPTIRGTLRQELLDIINPTLKTGHVDNIYFTDLLVQ